MSGTTGRVNASLLTPRGSASGVVVIAYDPNADSFVALFPSALQGLTGAAGPQGPAGPQGAQGVPGSAGVNGKTVLNGAGAPASGTGTNGDFYYDTQNKLFYGPKANGAWPAGFSIVGPTGPAGAPGSGGMPTGGTDGQILGNVSGAATWLTGRSIVADRTPTVTISAPTALTFAAHNRRRIVLKALAGLTLSAAEVSATVDGVQGWGMEFSVANRHTAVNTLTFGTGILVLQPASGTGTGQAVKVAAGTATNPAKVAVDVYRDGGTDVSPVLVAEVTGDVA